MKFFSLIKIQNGIKLLNYKNSANQRNIINNGYIQKF